jgi:internalin A
VSVKHSTLGLFYLLVFIVVIAGVGILSASIPFYVLPMVLIAGIIFVPLIGVLQLKNDDRLAEKGFIDVLKIVMGQLPLIGRLFRQLKPEDKKNWRINKGVHH